MLRLPLCLGHNTITDTSVTHGSYCCENITEINSQWFFVPKRVSALLIANFIKEGDIRERGEEVPCSKIHRK